MWRITESSTVQSSVRASTRGCQSRPVFVKIFGDRFGKHMFDKSYIFDGIFAYIFSNHIFDKDSIHIKISASFSTSICLTIISTTAFSSTCFGKSFGEHIFGETFGNYIFDELFGESFAQQISICFMTNSDVHIVDRYIKQTDAPPSYTHG